MIARRDLAGRRIGDVTVIDALRDGDVVRVFLGRDGGSLDPAKLDGFAIQRRSTIAGGPILQGSASGDLYLGGTPIPIATPEPDLLSGRRVLLGIRNGEAPDLVADWLAYHAEDHGTEAALILDRRRPDEAALPDIPLPDGVGRLLIVDAPVPLGGAGPSERHPIAAPDAPGKTRMTAPEDDPWTAPLSHMTVLEALRWRFLSDARSVAFLDPTDLLAPAGEGAFDRVERGEGPVIQLVGRRIYPWRVRRGRAPHYGDHVCDRFDDGGGNRRWAVDMRRLPDDQPFRLVRVGGLTPDPAQTAFFYRAMACRVTEGPEVPLAPKSSLRAEEDLLTLSRDRFGCNPVLPPPAIRSDAGGLPADLPGRTAIVTCMRNEGPYVLEWIAHHRAIGVDDFLIYTNDCTDGTDRLLDVLAGHGIVAHRQNPFRGTGLKPQHAALQAAEDEAILARAGWAICMDVDEFIDVHVGDGHLRDLYGAVGDANMISLTWRLFGNADQHHFDDRPTPERFTRSAPELVRKPHQAWGFKTLFRNLGIFKKMGVHRPKGLRPEMWEQINWVNGSGEAMPRTMLRNGWRSTLRTYGYGLASLNHYAVRDAESFLVKRDRGRVNHVDRDQGLGYWFRMNNNAETTPTFARHLPALHAGMVALRALPGVAKAEAACHAAHRARITELMQQPDHAALYAEITSPRMERLSRMHGHFGANVFLAGPDVVPDDVVFEGHAPDFFFTVEKSFKTVH